MKLKQQSRRELIKNIGGLATLVYPMLSSREAKAEDTKKRFVCFMSCAGVRQDSFWPKGQPNAYDFANCALEPLAPYIKDINVVRGLGMKMSENPQHGVDSHNGSATTLLTGNYTNWREAVPNTSVEKFEGNRAGTSKSIDQLIADKIQGQTLTRSLELALFTDVDRPSRNISYGDKGVMLPTMQNPYDVFATIFRPLFLSCSETGALTPEALMRLKRRKKSILDAIINDVDTTIKKTGLGKDEQQKLDSYLTSIREIEKRLAKLSDDNRVCKLLPQFVDKSPQKDIRDENYPALARMMSDLILAAFEMDITRVATLVYDQGGTDGVPMSWLTWNGKPIMENYHQLTHYTHVEGNWGRMEVVDRYHASEFAYFIKRLKETKVEGDKTLLDQSIAMWTSELGDGPNHCSYNMPMILAGTAGGAIKTGRYINLPEPANLKAVYGNLNYSMPEQNMHHRALVPIMNAFGVAGDSLGYMKGVKSALD